MVLQKSNCVFVFIYSLTINVGINLLLSEIRAQASVTNDSDCPYARGTDCNLKVKELRDSDEMLCGKDKMCLEYHDIMTYHGFTHPDLKIRNVTKKSINRPTTTIDYTEENAYVASIEDCPMDLSRGRYNSQLANESGFSPWKYIINRDFNRFPLDFLETRCECVECLNAEKTGHHHDYISRPLMVTRYFRMKGNGSTIFNAKFSFGCICEYEG